MSKTFKRMCIILAAVMSVMMMFTVCSFADDEDELYYGSPEILGQEVVLEDGSGNEYVNPDLPSGVEYDIDTKTMTLTNCTIDDPCSGEVYSYLAFNGVATIVLKGNNVFKGSTKEGFMGINSSEKLTIKGDGKLTMDFSKVPGAMYGILANNWLTIDGPEIDIIGGSALRNGSFYGMTLQPWYNYYINPVPSNKYGIFINNATVNISGAVELGSNVGIDSQDSDLSITNSRVQITLNGGSDIFGMGTGLHRVENAVDIDMSGGIDGVDFSAYGPVYGGTLTIDDKSWVTIKNRKESEYDGMLSMYYFVSNISSKYMYVGDEGTTATQTDPSKVNKHAIDDGFGTARYENEHGFIEFAPEAKTHDNPVIPKREEQQDDSGSDDEQQGGGSGSGDGQQGGGSGSGDGQQGGGSGSGDGQQGGGSGSGDGQQGGSGSGDSGQNGNEQPGYTPGYSTPSYEGLVTIVEPKVAYNGKSKAGNVIVYDSGDLHDLDRGVDYLISFYKGDSKSIGKCEYIVAFIGAYKNTAPVSGSFSIVPAKSKIKSAKAGKKKVTLKLKKLKGGVKYQIAYKYKGGWKYKTTKKTKIVLKKLKSNKKYTIRVRAFKKVGGKRYNGEWSLKKKVTIK